MLFFSSELAEIPLVCDRVIALYGGRVTAELPAARPTRRRSCRRCTGSEREAAGAA